MDDKFIKYIFLGYFDDPKSYRCYDSISRKLHISWDVIFHEGGSYKIDYDASEITLAIEESSRNELDDQMEHPQPL